MGLFEKQIPKYVRTPEEDVAIEPVVVDDIFDPLFNAEVKQRLADTYGNSPLATLEGYGELLGNIWQGNDSDFGKGMGLLSAFGRSMEKADDLVLGAATEVVEGLSGQGFDNPIKNIFVNDEDYTGRRFLAAAANTMRGFADGTTVTEEDFGPEWGLPSLGIELISDVGILGGGLARRFAPELAQQAGKRVSSSEIFRNLGKSGNAKTTIGEVGQLMSDYDDLMTRAAIDITAPGLRPAFKALLPRLKQFVGFTGAEDFVDVTMPAQRSPLSNLGDGSDGAFELYKNAYQVYKEIPETVEEAVERMSRTPEQIAEQVAAEAEFTEFNEMVEDVLEQEAASTVPVAQELVETTPKKRRPRKALRRSSELKAIRDKLQKRAVAAVDVLNLLYTPLGRTPRESTAYFNDVLNTFDTRYTARNVLAQPFPKTTPDVVHRAEREVLSEITPLSTNPFSDDYTGTYEASKRLLKRYLKGVDWSQADKDILMHNFEQLWNSNRLDVRDALRRHFTPDSPARPTSREMFIDTAEKSFTEAGRAVERFTVAKGKAVEESIKRARKYDIDIDQLGVDQHSSDTVSDRFAKLFTPGGEYVPIKEGQATKKVWAQTPPDFNELTTEQKQYVDEVRQMLSEALGFKFEKLSEHTYEPALTLNPTYLEDVLDAMSDDSKLAHAIYTGEWSTNAATNAQVNAFLNDPKRKDSLFYRTSNPDWYLSPSERALVASPEVKEGVSKAYSMIDDLGYLTDGDTRMREALWTNEDGFDDFVDSDGMQAALYTVFKYHDDTSPRSRSVAYVEGVHHPSMGDRHVKGFDDFSADDEYDMTEVSDDYFDLDPDEDPLKGHDLARELEKTPIGGKIAKFKRLLGNVLFPKPKPGKATFTEFDAFQALDELIEFYDKNFDIFDVPYEMLRRYPDEMSYLTFLSNTLETIARDFIAPIKGMGRASRDARLDFRFKNTDVVDDFTLNYDYLVKSVMGQLGSHKPSYDALIDILEPMRPFASFGFKTGSETLEYLPAPKQKLSPAEISDPSKRLPAPVREKTHAAKVVDRFYDEVLPSIEYLLDNDINPYTLKKMKRAPKHVSLEKLKKAMAYLGYDSPMAPDIVFDPDHVIFRDIFNYIYLHGEYGHSYAPDATFFKGLPKGASPYEILEHLASTGSPWGFKPSREARFTHTIEIPASPERTVTKPVTSYRTEPLHVNKGALTPEGIELWDYLVQLRERGKIPTKAMDTETIKARALASYSDQDLLQHFEDIVYDSDISKRKYLRHAKDDPKNPNTYREICPAVVRSAPVAYETVSTRTIGGTPAHTAWIPDASPRDLSILKIKSPSDFRSESNSILKGILNQEAQVLLKNPLWKSDVKRAYSEMASELERMLTAHGVSEERFKVILEDFKHGRVKKLTPEEVRFVRYYTMEYTNRLKNLPYYAVDLSTGAYYGSQESRDAFIRDMINGAEMTASERDTILSIFDSKKTPTRALTKYVKKVFIDKLGESHRKFTKFWHPVETLFDFDLPKVSSPDYIRIGESVPLFPDEAQFGYGTHRATLLSKLIANKPVDPSIVGAREIEFLGSLDYTKLFRPESRERLMQMSAGRDFQMDFIPDSPFEKKGAAEVYDNIRNTRYTYTVKPSAGTAPVVTEQVEQIIEAQPVEEVITQFVEPAQTSLQEAAVQATVNEICPTVVKYLESGIPEKQVGQILDGTDEWRWHRQIMRAANVRPMNASGDYATSRLQSFTDLAHRIENVSSKIEYKNLKRFYFLKEKQIGDILSGDKFWDEFISTGMFSTAYKKGSPKIEDLRIAMQHNADTINSILKGNFVEVVVHDISGQDPNTVAVTMRWISSKKNPNSDLIRRIANNKDALARAKYETLLFSPPETLSEAEIEFLSNPELMELSRLEAEAQTMIQEHYKHLGFTFDPSSSYTRHALNKNPDVAFFLEENFYKQVHSDTLDDICDQLSTLYDTRRAFGSRSVGRRFRGHYWDSERKVLPIFSYDPTVRFKSAITGGALANSQYQAFTDFFLSDTFKIKGTFNTIEDLKKVLYAKDPNGVFGNLTNAELVTFRIDATGRVIGLTKFDKMSDKGLQAALNDPNTILVPASAVTSLDKMFRREKRMSNKLWVFLNKHFTLPFKMGVLMNPGFLLGNISDATMKMATTMAKKYGTSMTHEAEEAARSMRTVVELKNMYYQAFDQFLESAEVAGFKVPVKESIPDIVAMNPKARKTFIDWVSGNLTVSEKIGDTVIKSPVECTLTSRQLEAVNTWMLLQEMQMNTSRLREFEDVAGLSKPSKFEKPNNMLGRVIEGKGNYDRRLKGWRTWGFFVNNPVVDGMMGASEGIEDLVRTATIIDDLRHHGYSDDRMFRVMTSGNSEDLIGLGVALENAKNAMYSAQFDYERLTDFLDTLGTAVPFPIFFLKNFVYWMDLFQNNPQFVDNMIDIQEGLWAHRKEEDENDEFAKEAKGRGAIPVGGSIALPEWFKGIYKPSPLQSMFGAFSLLNDPLGDMQYRLHPAISGAAAWAHDEAPTDLTTLLRGSEELSYRPYSTNMYERNVKESDPQFNAAEYAMHRSNPFERTVNTYLRTPEKIKKGEAQLSDFAPSVFQPDF